MKTKYKMKILHTSDIHGYVYPTSYSTKKEHNMGLAKLSTLINKLRTENTLLIDSGDIIQGSPLTYHYAKDPMSDTHPMAKVMNLIGYDYITIGNHEFNYGLNNLSSYLDHVDATILNSNILDEQTKKPYRGIAYDIITNQDGPTIGIIGVTTHYIPNWEQPSHIASLDIRDAFETTSALVQKLRDKVDLLIVSYHGGFERNFDTFELDVEDTGENQGSKMLHDIAGIDILLTGHQHRLLHGSKFGTTYSQPGFNAQYLMEINVEGHYDQEWSFTIDTTLHDTVNVDTNPDILEVVKIEEERTQSYLDQAVGHLDHDYLINDQLQARLHKHPLVSLINHVQLEYTHADISSCSLGNDVSGFKKDITIRDVIGTYIFPNTLVVKEMSGAAIIKALEKTAEFFDIENNEIVIADNYNHPKLQLYAYDMYDPIEYILDISKPKGNRVSNISLHGNPLLLDKQYSVVMNNYRAAGGGDYLFIKDCQTINDTQMEVIELLTDYIVEHNHITIPHTSNIKIVK